MKLKLFIALLLAGACAGEDPPPPANCAETGCPADQKCAPDGQCVANAECVADKDCKDDRKTCQLDGFKCVFRPGFADECDQLRPCAFGQFCSPLIGKCLDTAGARDCTRRSQCPAAQICDRSANKCVADPGCYGDQFCDPGEICDTNNRVCRALATNCRPCFPGTNACDSGQLCNLATKECLGGGQDAVCMAGEFCDPLGRCVQCTSNDQCGPGLYCNAALGRCDSNVQCARIPAECPTSSNVMCVLCTPPQMCNQRTKRCEAPALECANDTECPGGQFCDLMRDPPICQPVIPDCLNDLREGGGNDNPARAAPLPRSEGPSFDELKLCPGDVDWYAIEVEAGTYLTVDARFRHAAGDVELQLFLADGVTLIDESRSTTDNERVEIEIGTATTLLLKVFLNLPAIEPTPYRLIVAHDRGTICEDDAGEPNDDAASAIALVSDVPYEGRLCTADPDWFKLVGVPSGKRINLHLAFRHSLGDLDMEVYRPGTPTSLVVARSVTDDERLSFDASYGGDYFIRVFAKAADTNVYTLRAEIRDNPAAVCQDDRFEPNDHASMAIVAPDDTGEVASNLGICAGDEDWYKVELGPGEALRAEVGFSPRQDLELKLYAPGSTSATTTPIRASSGVSGREGIGFRAVLPGEYLLRVHGLNQRQISPYELRVLREPPLICEPDVIDQMMMGQDQATAFTTNPAPIRVDDLTICTGDEDWFELLLPAPFRHSMRIQFVDADAQLDFSILDPGGNVLATTQGPPFGADPGTREITGNVPGFGIARLFMRVFHTSGLETKYSLIVDSEPLTSCFADMFEPNDDVMTATPVVTSTIPGMFEPMGLTSCNQTNNALTGRGDEDWFVISAPARGVRMEAALEHDSGDLFMELFSPGGFARACLNVGPNRCYSDAGGLMERVAFTSTTAGQYFVRVGSIYGDPAVRTRPPSADTDYRLRISLSR